MPNASWAALTKVSPPIRKRWRIDPNSAEAREYLGEAYVETDRFDLARIELDRIAAICGNQTCEQYVDLAKAITKASP